MQRRYDGLVMLELGARVKGYLSPSVWDAVTFRAKNNKSIAASVIAVRTAEY